MIDELRELNIDFKKNASLSKYTTFALGGKCKGIFFCYSPAQIETTIQYLNENNMDFIVIGEGSNVLISDEGLDCYVIRYVSEEIMIGRKYSNFIISGCSNLDNFVQYAADKGLKGINFASGIPGTIGGAMFGNAGAFGKQIGDIVVSAILMDRNGRKKEVTKEELRFGYRDSVLKKTKDIVLSVIVSLEFYDKSSLLKEREEILLLRREKHPDYKKVRCAGSFFKNIDDVGEGEKRISAGLLLDQAGAKRMKCNGAKVFDKHANIIIAEDSCKSSDIKCLSDKMSSAVKDKFNIDLQNEVQFLGKF